MRNRLTDYSRLFLILFLLSTIISRADAADGDVVRILPLGDSITNGFGGQVSYRRDLWFKLQSEGYNVDFVGTRTNFTGTVPESLKDFDLDHQGVSGYEVGQLDANITSWMQNFEADIVLLHAGTNDIDRGQSISSTLDELSSLIGKLRAQNPDIVILLARIIPGRTLDTLPFNIALDSWVVGENTSASPIIVVDQHTGFDPVADNVDTLHPNSSGEAKIADKWFAALQTVLTPGNPGNQRPTADAGSDLQHASIEDPLRLSGLVTDDGLPVGSTVSVSWSQSSGCLLLIPNLR